ncbi:DUF1338 domain-containing protein [Photobacterium aquimaris]|uniref:2-oxoadipate dioxygenase/decarboxylase n=1 Tax=Photobacterium aquimaris TaxID=512643 RepID=A0A1Y6KZQ7_9GAMM|nr:DUF1338 domain-containing protein [Photobacterium aquimaris]SMY17660.1 hypothetical protein PAQU9191_02972 [Photobacterium aquimaris]
MESITQLFDDLWHDYSQRLCPSAVQIQRLLTEDAALLNDHIALRSFGVPKCSLAVVAAPFIALGYQPQAKYHFEAKKLYAEYFMHPDPLLPKVFISELQLGSCSAELQLMVRSLLDQVDDDYFRNPNFVYGGRPWQLDFTSYQFLVAESEYAAWVAAHGFGANHFTVSINQLEQFTDLEQVNHLLRHNQFVINQAGGEIKGDATVMLEQSATMADEVGVSFRDGVHSIPGGFYEFAKRYPQPNGELYSGFVTASADKIFESTNS